MCDKKGENLNLLYAYFPIHIDTISMGLSIVHLKGAQVELAQL